MIETKTVHSMTCDFCRSKIYSGETGDEWTKAIFYQSVTIELPSLWGETAVIHLCHNCQLKMRMLFERAHRHGKDENCVGMFDVLSNEQDLELTIDRMFPTTRLEVSPPNPGARVPYDSSRHFAIYF